MMCAYDSAIMVLKPGLVLGWLFFTIITCSPPNRMQWAFIAVIVEMISITLNNDRIVLDMAYNLTAAIMKNS